MNVNNIKGRVIFFHEITRIYAVETEHNGKTSIVTSGTDHY